MSSAGRDWTHPSRPFCFARVSPFERPDDVPPRIRRTGRIGHKTSGTNRLAGTMKQGIHSMATTAFPTRDDFAAMLDESLGGADGGFEGRVVKGTVTAIENDLRSEEHTSELQSLMRISYAVFCLKKKTTLQHYTSKITHINLKET